MGILGKMDAAISLCKTVLNRLEKARRDYNEPALLPEYRLINSNDYLLQAEGSAERLVDFVRWLPGEFINPDIVFPIVKKQAFEISGIKIDLTPEGFLHIMVPNLPRKKMHGTTSYINTPLTYAFEDFRERHPDFAVNKEGHHVVWYMFTSAGKQWSRRVDVDNFECNFITDAINHYYLKDDKPEYLSTCYTVGLKSERTMTHIFLIPFDDYPGFIKTAVDRYSQGFGAEGNTSRYIGIDDDFDSEYIPSGPATEDIVDHPYHLDEGRLNNWAKDLIAFNEESRARHSSGEPIPPPTRLGAERYGCISNKAGSKPE